MSAIPTWKVEIDWDHGNFGDPDAVFPGNADITSDVKSLRIRRGRDGDLSAMVSGRCQVILADQTGKYNPENSAATLAGKLRPMRQVRITATHPDTTDYVVFFGFVESIQHDPSKSKKETVVEVIDLFEWLATVNPEVSASATTIGAAMSDLLDDAGWTDVTARDLDAGRAVPTFSTDGSKTALSVLNLLNQADQGLFFIAKNGSPTFKAAARIFANESVVATYTESDISSVKSKTQLARIVNSQEVTKTGGSAQTATDATSITEFNTRRGDNITNEHLVNDGQASSMASWIVARHKNPEPPARAIEIVNRTNALLTQQLSREIGDFVRINENVGGTDVSGNIQRIELSATSAGKHIVTKFSITKKERTYFTIGTSAIGGSDIIGY